MSTVLWEVQSQKEGILVKLNSMTPVTQKAVLMEAKELKEEQRRMK
jgi:hypothetical protein